MAYAPYVKEADVKAVHISASTFIKKDGSSTSQKKTPWSDFDKNMNANIIKTPIFFIL